MKNHKFFSFVFRVCLIGLLGLLLANLPAKAEADFRVEKFDYNILSEKDLTVEATLNPYSFDPIVIVPQTVTYNDKTYRVVALADKSFSGKNWPVTVTLPESITRIGNEAFLDCYNLETIFLPNSITEIGTSAFSGCVKLETINIPTSLKKIEEKTFYNCKALKMIDIPGVTSSIGNYAFAECENLEILNLSQGVKDLGNNFIKDCNNLIEINVAEDNPFYASFMGILFNKELSEMILAPKGIESVELPATVKTIPDYIFAFSNLTSITIPSSVTKIGKNAFQLCENLTSVVIPNSVTEIGYGAFDECSNLENIQLPETLTSISGGLLTGCAIRTIKIPETVTRIGNNAFQWCVNLESIEIPENVETIESVAFSGCSSLKEIRIPNKVKIIPTSLFQDCTSLEKVYLPDDAQLDLYVFAGCENLTDIHVNPSNKYYYFEDGILFNKDKTEIVAFPSAKGEVVLPDFVTKIASCSFAFNKNLISINFPANVNYIGGLAFNQDVNLKTVICNAPIPPSLSSSSFIDEGSSSPYLSCDIFVPDDSVNIYKATSPWNIYKIYPISKLSGVETVVASTATGLYTVYTLDGRMVMQTGDHASLNSLPEGIYIVNGKKVLIHK